MALIVVAVAVVIFAIAARIEAFPLSWAPMYARRATFQGAQRAWVNAHGCHFEGLRVDGTPLVLTAAKLNVGRAAFRRLCTDRMNHEPWHPWLLRSINNTLGFEPADARRIVTLRSTVQRIDTGFLSGDFPELRPQRVRLQTTASPRADGPRPRAKSWQHPDPSWAVGTTAVGLWLFAVAAIAQSRRPLWRRARRAWDDYWFAGGELLSLGLLRAVVGFGLVFWLVAGDASSWSWLFRLDPVGPSFEYLSPIWYFRALGVEAQFPWALRGVYAVLLFSALCVCLGARTRVAAVVAIFAIAVLKGARDSQAGDTHHREIMWVYALLVLACSRCDHAFSLSTWLGRRRGKSNTTVSAAEAAWPIRLVQVLIISFYFAAGVAKLRLSGAAWLDGELIQGLLFQRAVRDGIDPAGLGLELARHAWLCQGLACASVALELAFPVLLFLRPNSRLQIAFLSSVCAFHWANGILCDVKFGTTPFLFAAFLDLGQAARGIRARGNAILARFFRRRR